MAGFDPTGRAGVRPAPRRQATWRGLGAALVVGLVRQAAAAEFGSLEFNRDIRPILSEHCFACHGFDAKKRHGGLRLDVAEGALSPADSGSPAILPGNRDASGLWQRIHSDDADVVMPPPSTNKPLSAEQKALLGEWIRQGAAYQKHWAFEAPEAGPLPAVRDSRWIRQPIDRFVLATLEARGLAPRNEADRATLIRRVAFTLTGLPPTPAEVAEFEGDESSTAYEAMVERYLRSPQYGEEMARHWLDVARYADTHGLHLDNERTMWAYRDWVINAFNANLPFDDFTTHQLAGDLLPHPTDAQLVATGFNRCNVTTSEGGAIDQEFLFRYAVDRASTTVQAWMGLTGGCAVCHDHKYDPITARDFYSLYAFFYSAADPAMDGNVEDTPPTMRLATDDQKRRSAHWREELASARERADALLAAHPYVEPTAATATVRETWLDDAFAAGASTSCSTRNASVWAKAPEAAPLSGVCCLKQASSQNYEDRLENPTVAWIVPRSGKLSLGVFVDAAARPSALRVELTTSQGPRALLWGDDSRYGGADAQQRMRVGDVPAGGAWTRVEYAWKDLNLQPGDRVTGLKLAQFGGVALWDAVEFSGETPLCDDVRSSFALWRREAVGVDVPGVPADVAAMLKDGPEKHAGSAAEARLLDFYRREIARPAGDAGAAVAAWRAVRDKLAADEQLRPLTFIFRDQEQPRQAHVMERGQYDKPGEAVEPSTPAFLPPLEGLEGGRRASRLDLARWLVSEAHPLTARVTVNRFWQQVFGTGLVKTSYDFGSQGEVPSHPALLDWLAVWYRQNGWDTRSLMRMLVCSATFRQHAAVDEQLLQTDPENRLLARGPRIRLAAEQIRDNVLFVSGLIDLTQGGRGVNSYQPANVWEPVGYQDSNTRFYLQDHGGALYRRSIYAFFKRTAPPPFMSNFDAPNREQFCTIRERSNTPLQSLQLMNDTQHFEGARKLGERMLREGGTTPAERIAFGYRIVLARPPRPEELSLLVDSCEHYAERYGKDPEAARRVASVGESPAPGTTPPAEAAAYAMIGNLILNLDETITRN